MEIMTWTEALFLTKEGLKGYRERNNITLPEEYKEASGRYLTAAMFWIGIISFVGGIMVGRI